jgi:hypothetical protein
MSSSCKKNTNANNNANATEKTDTVAITKDTFAQYDTMMKQEKEKQKKYIIDKLNKDEMAELILKQNNLLKMQSSQLIDVINIANNIEVQARKNEQEKCTKTTEKESQCYEKKYFAYNELLKMQYIIFILLLMILCFITYKCYKYIKSINQEN